MKLLDLKEYVNKLSATNMLVVEVKNKRPAVNHREWLIPKLDVSSAIVLDFVGTYYNDEVYTIYYYDKTGRRFSRHVLKDDKLYIIEGERRDKILESLKVIRENSIVTKLSHSFTTGSDPEVFVENASGEVIPAFTFLKHKNDKNVDRPDYGDETIYWDGFQAEFTVLSANCLQQVRASITRTLHKLAEIARKHNKGAKLSIKTAIQVDENTRLSLADEHVALGCMPSLNAYGIQGESITDGRALSTRSTGGHIHFGFAHSYGTRWNKEKAIDVVKAMDAIIGVMCVSLFAKFDDKNRRRYYGLAGEYRLPKHGLEYRVLSNAWLAHPFIFNIVFDVARKAAMVGFNGYMNMYKGTEKEIIDCINNCDVDKARELMERNKDLIMQVLCATYQYKDTVDIERLYRIFYEGMETVIANPEDIEGNWQLDRYSQRDGYRNHKPEVLEFYKGIDLIMKGKIAS